MSREGIGENDAETGRAARARERERETECRAICAAGQSALVSVPRAAISEQRRTVAIVLFMRRVAVAVQAHEFMRSNANVGKITLRGVPDGELTAAALQSRI